MERILNLNQAGERKIKNIAIALKGKNYHNYNSQKQRKNVVGKLPFDITAQMMDFVEELVLIYSILFGKLVNDSNKMECNKLVQVHLYLYDTQNLRFRLEQVVSFVQKIQENIPLVGLLGFHS